MATTSTPPASVLRSPRTVVVTAPVRPDGATPTTQTTTTPAFGTSFGEAMAVSRFDGTAWTAPDLAGLDAVQLHPASHALHYASACFEGLKAHRQPDGSVRAFRAADHVARLRQSAARLCLPVPDAAVVRRAIELTVDANADVTPAPPGSLYLRPTLLGTDPAIGAAAHPSRTAVLFVLASPVGEYLPPRPLTVAVETRVPRTTPQFGLVKAGANYAMALPVIEAARERDGADQVLFAPGGVVEETGASNVILMDGDAVITPELTDGFLHGITRDSLLRVARSLGWRVEERQVDVRELVELAARPDAEVALTGTAAVVASVGTLVIGGERLAVGTHGRYRRVSQLRDRLVAIQTGREEVDWA